jgi:hypothetical protein
VDEYSLVTENARSFEMSLHMQTTRRHGPVDSCLHSHAVKTSSFNYLNEVRIPPVKLLWFLIPFRSPFLVETVVLQQGSL